MKVLYMSGYTPDTIVSRGLLRPGIAFIEKHSMRRRCARKFETFSAHKAGS
jgi:hypothetical protein